MLTEIKKKQLETFPGTRRRRGRRNLQDSDIWEKMSAAFKFSSRLRELRIHLCHKGSTSNGVREFIQNYYASLKQSNPTCPILVRECEGIQPKLWARFENGVEDVYSLSNKSASDILKQVESVAKDGIVKKY